MEVWGYRPADEFAHSLAPLFRHLDRRVGHNQRVTDVDRGPAFSGGHQHTLHLKGRGGGRRVGREGSSGDIGRLLCF